MRILAIDDESLVLETWELQFGSDHHLVGVTTAEKAREVWASETFDVVLLDQNLEGWYRGTGGLDLIDEIRLAQPTAEIYVVSGYPDSPGAVATAINRGVQDYLVKGLGLFEILSAKLAQTAVRMELRRRAAMRDADWQAELDRLWLQLKTESGAQAKGRMLEDLVEVVLHIVGGFGYIETRAHRKIEEMDVVAVATSAERLSWSRVWVFECKHWAMAVGREQVDVLLAKMKRRHGQCRLGFLVAWSGLSAPAHQVIAHDPDGLVVVLTQNDLANFVAAPDKPRVLDGWLNLAAAK